MGELIDLNDKIKRYFKFSPTELRSIVITILVLSFVVGFDDGRPTSGLDFFWVMNLVNSLLVVALSFLVQLSVKKIVALHIGFRAEYNLWSFGLLASAMLAFLSTGLLHQTWWVLLAGGIMLQHIPGHRLGFFRYDINYYEAGWISMIGPLSNIALAAVFRMLSAFTTNALITKAITFNLLFALYNALPIPPLDGSRMFFGSRMVYALSFCFILAAVILLWIDIPVWISLAGSVLLALVGWLLYYIFAERGFWKGPYP